MDITRREFIRRAAGAVALGAGGSWAVAAPADAAWAFPFLGDLHIDRPEHHDMAWLAKDHHGDVSQVQNYCRITRDVTPKLLAVARQQATDSRAPVPFVLQIGDFVEGLCGSEQLAAKQADDAIDLVRQAAFPVPFLFTKGNHDITGPGAPQVYDKKLVPFLAAQARDDIRTSVFTRDRDGTLVVFYDAYNRDSLDWFDGLMKDRKPRRLLFVIHPPVVPYNARSNWHVYARPTQQKQRDRLLDLLGRARAVVLSGHLHKYSFLVRRTDGGRFAQLAVSSVAASPDGKPRDQLEGVDKYTPDLVNLEPKHAPDTVADRRRLLEAEKPFIEHFEYADTWGHALVTVAGDRVRAAVCRGLDRQAWKSLDLTGPLG